MQGEGVELRAPLEDVRRELADCVVAQDEDLDSNGRPERTPTKALPQVWLPVREGRTWYQPLDNIKHRHQQHKQQYQKHQHQHQKHQLILLLRQLRIRVTAKSHHGNSRVRERKGKSCDQSIRASDDPPLTFRFVKRPSMGGTEPMKFAEKLACTTVAAAVQACDDSFQDS